MLEFAIVYTLGIFLGVVALLTIQDYRRRKLARQLRQLRAAAKVPNWSARSIVIHTTDPVRAGELVRAWTDVRREQGAHVIIGPAQDEINAIAGGRWRSSAEAGETAAFEISFDMATPGAERTDVATYDTETHSIKPGVMYPPTSGVPVPAEDAEPSPDAMPYDLYSIAIGTPVRRRSQTVGEEVTEVSGEIAARGVPHGDVKPGAPADWFAGSVFHTPKVHPALVLNGNMVSYPRNPARMERVVPADGYKRDAEGHYDDPQKSCYDNGCTDDCPVSAEWRKHREGASGRVGRHTSANPGKAIGWTGSISDGSVSEYAHLSALALNARRPWYVRAWRRITGQTRRDRALAIEAAGKFRAAFDKAWPMHAAYQNKLEVQAAATASSWEQALGRINRKPRPWYVRVWRRLTFYQARKRARYGKLYGMKPWYVRAWRRLLGHKTLSSGSTGLRVGDGPLKMSGIPGEWFVKRIASNDLVLRPRRWYARFWRWLTRADARAARRYRRELADYPADDAEDTFDTYTDLHREYARPRLRWFMIRNPFRRSR